MPRTKVRLGLDSPLEDRLAPAAAGDLDPAFGTGGVVTVPFPNAPFGGFFFGPTPVANAAVVQPDGRIILAGSVPSSNLSGTGGTDIAVVRLLPNGSLDPTFGVQGRMVIPLDLGGQNDDTARAVALQPDGGIVVAGSATTASNGLDFIAVRLTPDGFPDATFGTAGVVDLAFNSGGSAFNDDEANAVAIQPDGKIVLAGYSRFDFAAARLNADGTPDASFGTKGMTTIVISTGGFDTDAARAIALQPDGKIVLAGYSDGNGFQNDFAATRLNPNGSVDATFGTKGRTLVGFDLGGSDDDQANGVALQSDGKIVLVGTVQVSFPGLGSNVSDIGVVRLNADGTPDLAFGTAGALVIGLNLGGNFTDEGKAVVVQPDDKIVVAGSAERSFTVSSFAAVRLNPDGSFDDTFGTGGKTTVAFANTSFFGPAPAANAVALQPDGNIVMAGNSSTTFAAVRLFGEAPPAPPEPPVPPEPPIKKLNPKVPLADLPPVPDPVLAGGKADGTASVLLNQDGAYAPGSVLTFFPGLGVSVRTAVADVNGDLIPDYIGGTGPGTTARVLVIDGKSGNVLADFQPFEDAFTGGVFVAAGDLNGDGRADLVVTPDVGGGPVVAVYDGAKLVAGVKPAFAQVVRFLGIDDPNFRGGARAALGDVNADGTPDLVVAAGTGGGPRVAILNGKDVAAGATAPAHLVPDFFAFEPGVRNGAFVSAGDVDGDGFADLAFGGGPDGAPRVRVVSGKAMLTVGAFSSLDQLPGSGQIANFFAGDPASRGGVRVSLRDVDGDDKADLTVGSGEGEAGKVQVFSAPSLVKPNPQPSRTLDPFGTVLSDGAFVG
jgi:uncharacterized delta-60 repeat protein